MIPDKITLKIVKGVKDGKPEVVEQDYYFKFAYNSIKEFRKARGLSLEGFADIFSEMVRPEKERDIDKMAEANECFGELFYYALKEGMRQVKEPFDLTIDDIQDFLNDTDNYEDTLKIAGVYQESVFKGNKKKAKESQ